MTRRPLDLAVLLSVALLACAVAGMGRAHRTQEAQAEAPGAAGATFKALDVLIDSGDAHLAAYQFELIAPDGVELVGVENGEHIAFADAPYYDTRALGGGRIIIAAFNTGEDLPTGKTRVCRLHVRESGPGNGYKATLTVAADADGQAIDASIEINEE